MKHLLTIALLAFYLTLYSQKSAPADSLQHGLNKADSIQLPTTPIDSAIQAVQAKLHASSDAPDSTKNRLQQQLNQLNKQQVTHQKLDSLQNLYQKRADSLQTLNLPHQNYLDKIDSITQLPGCKINQKLTQWQQGAREKLNRAQGQLDPRITKKLPDTELPGIESLDLPTDGFTDQIDNDLLPEKLDTELNTDQLTDLQKELDIDNPLDTDLLNDTPLDDWQNQADDITKSTTTPVDNLKGEANIDQVTAKLNEYSGQAGEVAEQTAKVKAGDFTNVQDQAEEEIIKEFDELGTLDEQKSLLDQTRAEHEEYIQLQKEYIEKAQQYNDPTLVKQRITQKSKYIANGKLKAYQVKVAEAQEKLSQLKTDSSKALLDIPKAEEWPIRERLIAGANLELFRSEGTQLDFTPYIGFQLTERLHVYASYLYRIDFNKDKQQLNVDNTVYGARLAATYRFFKGFYLRTSGEQLRTFVPNSAVPGEQQRDWVRSFYAGVGNRYNISRHMKGTVQVMYNFSYNRDTPFPNRYNIRLGFEIDFKKRTTKKDVIEGLKKAQKKKRMLESIKKNIK
ncbi:MAG: hypothetical protein AAF149_18675 [Bacteroidota bacterium]